MLCELPFTLIHTSALRTLMPEKFLDDVGTLHLIAALNSSFYTKAQTDAMLVSKANSFTPRTSGPFAGCSTLEQLVTRLESIFAGNTSITGINVE